MAGYMNYVNTALSSMGIFYYVFMVLIGLGFFGLLLWFIWFQISFKHKIVFRKCTNEGKKHIIENKFKYIIDSEGIEWLKLKKKLPNKQRIIPVVSDSEVINIDNKGREHIEAFYLGDGSVIYIKDVAKPLPEDILSIKSPQAKKEAIKKYLESAEKTIVAFDPLNTNQKIIMTNQWEKAQKKRGKNWRDFVLPIAYIGSITIIIAIAFMFANDVAKPVIEINQQHIQAQEIQRETTEILRDLKQDIQTIKNERDKDPPDTK